MRVTDAMIFNNASVSVGRARERVEAKTEESSSGLRVSHPGDDPGASALVVGQRMQQARFQAISQGTARASDELASADSAMDAVGNVITRARELAVQFSNSTYSAQQRADGANAVAQLMGEAIAALNTAVGGRYIFGGNKDNAPPFDASGNYLGDTGVRQVEIAPGVLQAASVRADVAVKGTGGGTDILATLTQLQSALSSNNVSGVQATLTGLDAGIAQVSSARSQAGVAMNTLDAATQIGKSAVDQAKTNASHLVEADFVDSASQLALAQRALEASLAATGQSFKLTILDQLR